MNIIFNDVDRMSSENLTNVKGTTTESSSLVSANTQTKGISLDISSKVTDNAYRVQGRTMKDIANAAKAMDPEVTRDFMTVMSNCVSTEDFQRMQREGCNPCDADIEEVVTIVDHIKAAMIKGGADVAGYTDTISDKALESITGSKTYSDQLKKECEIKDIPLTEENAKNIITGFNTLNELPPVSDGAKKYIVDNDLTPSVNNLYTASYASGNTADRQSRGYYSAGVSGYFAKKPDEVNVESLKPQMEEIVKSAGYESNAENIDKAAWLVKKGIPLTDATYKAYMDVSKISLPMSFEEFADHATDAIADGIKVMDADLSKNTSLRDEAVKIYDEVKNLGTIKGRRVLEEVRLQMSVEANLKLLRSGFSIDTAPMEDLIQNLKEIEKEFAINLTGDENEIEAVRKKNIFDQSINAIDNIKTAPISFVSSIEITASLESVSVSATRERASYEKAGKAYEELMTAPRRDLGDSITKAFGNIDDILSDMDLALTEENRRAVRVLGYNEMELTNENISAILEKDRLLTDTIEKMTPARVLSMIRDNVNPLEISVSDLNEYLNNVDIVKEDMMSFGKFLYKVSKDEKISEDEKEAFIGIYRLVRQIEKNDFNSVGAIEQLGTEFNFENMLSALRSTKHKNMDYRVDEHFGGVDAIDRGIASITSQIARGYLSDTSDLKKILEAIGSDEARREFEEKEAEEFRASFRVESEVISELKNMDMSLSASNLSDMQVMLNNPKSVFEQLRKAGYKKDKDIDLSSKEKAKESFESFTGSVKDFIENAVFGTRDISLDALEAVEFSKLHRRMDLINNEAAEENYLIPVEMDGKLTAVNLKVIHKSMGSKVNISFDDDELGKLEAEFKATNKGLSGYCVTSKSAENIIPDAEELKDLLSKEGIELKEMYFSLDEKLDVKKFRTSEANDKDTDVISTDELYKTAKVFIEYISTAEKH